ncbi:MAG: DNA repair protein RecN [Clostridiaceae bacterium]|nr:DNA repair protein RecN [Clostridiaceae bacterium]
MLTRIEIRDFALIEQMTLEPDRGLLILTGETGAGKSILIDAIGALSGGRLSRDMIRHGETQASVEAVFNVGRALLPPELLEQLGLDETVNRRESKDSPDSSETPAAGGSDNMELILSRELSASGKSTCRINGRLAPLSLLRDLSQYLIDIHGQHDQQVIFQVDNHLPLLDRFAGEPVVLAQKTYLAQLQQYQNCLREMAALGADPAERARQLDLLAYQVQEIEAAALLPGEDDRLNQRRKIVANSEKIRTALSEAYELLEGDDSRSIMAEMGQVAAKLELVARHTQALDSSGENIAVSLDKIQDTAAEIRNFLETSEADPGELERLDDRLDVLYRLKKKYGGSIETVLDFQKKADAKRRLLSDGEARYDQLTAQKEKIRGQLIHLAGLLSAARRKAANRMEALISAELADLGMKGVCFSVHFAELPENPEHFSRSGLDQVEFLLSANPGEPLRPLARIASGGEASRIMLAIKTILARADRIPVLIFDEIDTGISGRTAGKVGEKLLQISQGHQVFCITHMAQIAAMADEHWLIEKNSDGGRTRTLLHELNREQRESELARLLSGGIGDGTARQLADQLLSQAAQLKTAT